MNLSDVERRMHELIEILETSTDDSVLIRTFLEIAQLQDIKKIDYDLPSSRIIGVYERHPSQELRVALIRLFRDTRCSRAFEFICSFLEDQDPIVRSEIAWTLGENGRSDAVSVLARLLDDPDVTVRLRAAGAIGTLCNKAGVECLLQHLNEKDNRVLSEIINALGKLKDRQSADRLLRIYGTSGLKLEISDALRRITSQREEIILDKFPMGIYNSEIVDISKKTLPVTSIVAATSAVFDSVRAYCLSKGGAYELFRVDDHLARLERSMGFVDMDTRYVRKKLKGDITRLVSTIKDPMDLYLRILSFFEPTNSMFPGSNKDKVNTLVNVVGVASNLKYPLPCNASISVWRRPEVDSVDYKCKSLSNYNCYKDKTLLSKGGREETFVLDRRGYVLESRGANLFVVKDNTICTPPVSENLLEGITRDSVIEVLKSLDISTRFERVAVRDLLTADEVFCTGTLSEIKPIVNVNGTDILYGKIGQMTRNLITVFRKLVYEDHGRFGHWFTEAIPRGE